MKERKTTRIIESDDRSSIIDIELGLASTIAEEAEDLVTAFEKKAKKVTIRYTEVRLDEYSKLEYVFENFINFQKAKGLSKYTIANYKTAYSNICRFLEYTLGIPDGGLCPLKVLAHPTFDATLREWLEKRLATQSVIGIMRFYRLFYRYCASNDWVEEKKITIKAQALPVRQLFTNEQIERLLEKPKIKDNFPEYRNWVMVNLAYGTGTRLGSMAAIRMKDCQELNEGYLILNTTKGKKPIRVNVPMKVVKIINEYIRHYRNDTNGEDILFCNQFGEEFSPNTLSKIIKLYITDRLGTEDLPARSGAHLLRHCFAAKAAENGLSTYDLQHQLGHSSLEMTTYYCNHYGKTNHTNFENAAPINEIRIKKGRKKIK